MMSPAVARWVETTPTGVSWLGFFYGGNIAGAVFGCLFTGFYLLRVYDGATATYVAAALNALVAFVGWAIATANPRPAPAFDAASDAAIDAPSPADAAPDDAGLPPFPAITPLLDARNATLFVGNSYTFVNNLPDVLAGVAAQFLLLGAEFIGTAILVFFACGVATLSFGKGFAFSGLRPSSMGIVATALAFVLQSWAQQNTTPARAAILFSLEPVFAWIASWILEGEMLTLRAALGALLILGGILVVELKPAQAPAHQ